MRSPDIPDLPRARKGHRWGPGLYTKDEQRRLTLKLVLLQEELAHLSRWGRKRTVRPSLAYLAWKIGTTVPWVCHLMHVGQELGLWVITRQRTPTGRFAVNRYTLLAFHKTKRVATALREVRDSVRAAAAAACRHAVDALVARVAKTVPGDERPTPASARARAPAPPPPARWSPPIREGKAFADDAAARTILAQWRTRGTEPAPA